MNALQIYKKLLLYTDEGVKLAPSKVSDIVSSVLLLNQSNTDASQPVWEVESIKFVLLCFPVDHNLIKNSNRPRIRV